MIFLKQVVTLTLFLILGFALTALGQEIERNPKEAYFEVGKEDYIKEWLVIGPFPRELEADFLQAPGGQANTRPYEGVSVTGPDGKSYVWKRYRSESDLIDLQDAMKQLLFSLELALQRELDDDNERLSGNLRQKFENNGISLSPNATISIGNRGSQWWITDKDNQQEYLIVREEEGINIYSEPENAVAYVACNLLSSKAQRLEMVMERYDSVKAWLNGALVHSTPKRNRWDTERFGIPLRKGENLCLIKLSQYVAGTETQWGFKAQVQDYEAFLRSLELDLTIRRQNPDGRDELTISARREPQSTVWKLSSLPVHIEIRDNASQLLATLKAREGEYVAWMVPEEVRGTVRILGSQTDRSGTRWEAKFICQAHNIVPISPQLGHWETYDVTNGLGGSNVVDMIQDRNGVLWFALQAGGVRYDGRTFRTFTMQDGLPGNNIWAILEDSRGELWFGTNDMLTGKGSAVCRYDGETFHTFTTRDGLAGDTVIAIHEDDRGHLWFGTWGGGVSKFDGRTFQNHTRESGLSSDLVGAITQDKEGHFWFGHGRRIYAGGSGATRYDGKSYTHFTTKDGLAGNAVDSISTDAQGNVWFGTFGGASKYDGKTFQNFTTAEGLCHNAVFDVLQTRDGDLWFATMGGVNRYRDGEFQSFTTKEGLAHDWTTCITEDREGNLWFGTFMAGISRYDNSIQNIPVSIASAMVISKSFIKDKKGNLWFNVSGVGLGRYNGKSIQTFAMEDGLPSNTTGTIYEDSRGNIWIGTFAGLAKYDGERFQTFTRKNGLSSNLIHAIYEDKQGVLWLGTQGGGVCTYDGVKFVRVAGNKELGGGWLGDIVEDSSGNMWFSVIGGGLCKYDGVTFSRFTTQNGLPADTGYSLLADSKGNIWFGTEGGLCRHDGTSFRKFSVEDGLPSNLLLTIFEDSQSNLWIGTNAGGVSKFDGRNFQIFTTKDGLPSNTVPDILEDEDGNIIFGTTGGITIYSSPKERIPPPVSVTRVVADKEYRAPEKLKIPSTAKHISFAYHGMSFKTNRMRYNYILEGHDTDWQATWDEAVSYENLKPGEYIFKVIAINRDLVYSETPATVKLAIVPPFYMQASFLIPTVVFGTCLMATLIILATGFIKRRRQVHAYEHAAVQELHDARRMQMSLLPKSAPPLEGFDIAGFSHPAREVGGDFFDYLSLPDERIGVAIADVSGKGLKGAMNAVMTNGMLHEVATVESACGGILSALNAHLYPRVEKHMFTALGLAMLEQDSMTLQWANAAQPYPMVRRGEQVFEFRSDSELPLGMMLKVVYPDWELELQKADIVIFYTDGIIEAENEAEEMYGTERLEEAVTHIDSTASAEEIIKAILQDVADFVGTAEQYDDMTVVVMKKL
jgi:ligand-binding sensor domain-containing protein